MLPLLWLIAIPQSVPTITLSESGIHDAEYAPAFSTQLEPPIGGRIGRLLQVCPLSGDNQIPLGWRMAVLRLAVTRILVESRGANDTLMIAYAGSESMCPQCFPVSKDSKRPDLPPPANT